MDRRYHYHFGAGTGVRVLATLNGVPFYRCEPSLYPCTRSGLANHLLRPGRNEFSIEITRADPTSSVWFSVVADDDQEGSVLDFQWPEIAESLPPEESPLPFFYGRAFDLEGLTLSPVYEASPIAEFDDAELERVRDAAARFHKAFADKDADAAVSDGALKIAEYRRFYPDAEEGAFSEASSRRVFRELFDGNMKLKRLDRDQMVVRPYAGGRVAYVTGPRGTPAIVASNPDHDSELARDLWFAKHNGQWRLFR